MLRALTRKWWLTLVNGICTTLLGVLAFVHPEAALVVVLVFCALYWCIDGVQSAALGLSMRHARSRLSWALILNGALSIGAAFMTLSWPRVTAGVMLFIVAIWAIAIGISEIITAIQLRKYVHREWLFYAMGVLSIMFGIAVLLQPVSGVMFLVWMLGAFALVRGSLLCAFALELRGIRRTFSTTHHPPFASHLGH
jgi:uncharacterized membrane protein HdeD (DUF308 family)